MNIAIEQLILITILIVVILLVLVLLSGSSATGGNVDTQTKLRLCCNAFLANDCMEEGRIGCRCTTTIDENGDMETNCPDDLTSYIADLGWDIEDVKRFCNCPE